MAFLTTTDIVERGWYEGIAAAERELRRREREELAVLIAKRLSGE